MSKRRQQRLNRSTPCGICEAPTADHATICRRCTAAFRGDLRDVGDVEAELDVSCAGERGASYSPLPKGGGSAPSPNWDAIEARRGLSFTLGRGAAYAARDEPGSVPALPRLRDRAGFLLERVPALTLDPLGAHLAMAVSDGLARAREVIDLKPERQYLGECTDCGGRVYAEKGQDVAVCQRCGALAVAENLRGDRLAELDDRLCTAAEIAGLVTHLGLRGDRDKVRKRINTWHARRVILAAPGWGEPRFSFGLVRRKLDAERGNEQARTP